MRLLIIGINYAPEEAGNAPYTTGFAEHMASIGHEVHILTGVPHYPGWKKRPTSDLDAADHVRNGVNVHRRQHYVPGRQSAVRRALYEASFLASAPSLLSLPRPDAVVGVVPILSDGLLASIASRRFGVPFGLIFQDLMGQAATQSAMSGGASVGGVVRAGEGWIARRASAVAIVADSFRPYVESLGVPPQAIVRVSNWNHIPTAETPRDEIRRELAWPSDEFVCLHAGNMGYKQGLANVIECARLAKDASPELLFVLAGDGNQRPELERAASEYELPNLRFLPTQTDQAYADLLGAADALILHQSGSVTDMSFPSKVGAYVASGTPIVAAVAAGGAVAHELELAGAALVVEPEAPDRLLDAIARLRHDELLRRRLVSAAALYSRRFSREDALDGLESFVARIAGREEVVPAEEPLVKAA